MDTLTETQEFLFACKEERIAFVNKVRAQDWNTDLRVNAENILIMYDQLIERLSKREEQKSDNKGRRFIEISMVGRNQKSEQLQPQQSKNVNWSKEWWEKKPLPTYLKTDARVIKEGVDFEYKTEGHIAFKDGGGLLASYAKPSTEKEYLVYHQNK